MKVVIATPLYPPEIGGPATYSALLERELPRRGWSVWLVKFSQVRQWPRVISHLKYAYLVYRAARQADVVYALDPVSVGLPALLAATLAHRPFVVRVAGDYAWEQGVQRFMVTDRLDDFAGRTRGYGSIVYILKTVQTFVVKCSHLVIVPSFYLKSIIKKWGIPIEKIRVIYSVFEGQELSIKQSHSGYEKKKNNFIIMSAGRLVPWKGFEDLIRIVAELKRSFPNISLRVAGCGPDEGKLKELTKSLQADDFVEFLGETSRVRLYETLAESDLFVLNTSYEGFSHQLLEVMAMGVPIITTAVGGNPELIQNGYNGFLVAIDDRPALQSAIKKVLAGEVNIEELVENAKMTLQQFNQETMINQFISCLQTYARS